MSAEPKILIFCPSIDGGIPEHAYYQANALEKAGAKVTCLVAPGFLEGRPTRFEKIVCLANAPAENKSRLSKRLKLAWHFVANNFVLAWQVWKQRPGLVLLACYAEYLAPIWIWPHWFLARVCRIRHAANLHDPVRNFRVGPVWWHKLSVRVAYLPLDFVLVHDKLPEPSPVPAKIRVEQVPVGLYEVRGSMDGHSALRDKWGAADGQKVFLSFGYVRDGKNLDLSVRALAQVPKAFLVVAGSLASPKDKPVAYYRELAEQLGVSGRCHFFEGFVSDTEVGGYFAAADFVLLTYASTFHSQSGVLNVAARARKPVLASAAPSPMIKAVNDFQLGVSVKPDSLEAVVEGMRQLVESGVSPDWEGYESYASWDANARKILELVSPQKTDSASN
jgi:glycosyltransferase involved in cell wall biosynthesis